MSIRPNGYLDDLAGPHRCDCPADVRRAEANQRPVRRKQNDDADLPAPPYSVGVACSGRSLRGPHILPARPDRATRHCPFPTIPSPPAYPRNAPGGGSAAGRASPGRTAASPRQGRPERLGFVFEHGANLLLIDAREPLDELPDRSAAGQVFVEREQGNPRAGENPRAADLSRRPFHRRAWSSSRSSALLLLCHAPLGNTEFGLGLNGVNSLHHPCSASTRAVPLPRFARRACR